MFIRSLDMLVTAKSHGNRVVVAHIINTNESQSISMCFDVGDHMFGKCLGYGQPQEFGDFIQILFRYFERKDQPKESEEIPQ